MKTENAGKFSLILICLMAVSAWGTAGRCSDFPTPSDNQLYVFNYDQMMELTPRARVAYIKFIRDFMVQEEKLYPTSWESAGLSSHSVDEVASLFWSVAEADTEAGEHKDTGEICYFGGNRAHVVEVTTTDATTKKQSTRYMCWASTVEDDNGAKADDSFCKTQKIGGTPGVACNKMIFGTQDWSAGGKPFCVARGQNATRDCDKASDVNKAAARFKAMSKADQDKWNDYATKMKAFCDKNNTPECTTLKTRLAAIEKYNPPTKTGADQKPVCAGLYIPDGQTDQCAGPGCRRTWLMGTPDTKNPGKFTDLVYSLAPTTKEKDASGCQSHDQSCYDQVKSTVAGAVTQDPATGVVTAHYKKDDADVAYTIDLKSCTLAKNPNKPAPPADPCKQGDLFCSSDNWPKCAVTQPEHYVMIEKRNGHDKAVHEFTDGKGNMSSDIDSATEDKTQRGSQDFLNHLAAITGNDAQVKRDMENWEKEAGADNKKDSNAGASNVFGNPADPNAVAKTLNSTNDDFVEGVMGDLAVQKRTCPSQSWIEIKEAQAAWAGAASTKFFACGTADSSGKVKTFGGGYVKVHFNQDGTPMMAETGQLDKNGRAISADLFRPTDNTPYMSIGLKLGDKTDKNGKAKPVKDEGFLHHTREFEATVNHACPSSGQRYMAVLKETDPQSKAVSFRTCTSESASSGFTPGTFNFTQGSDGKITAPDADHQISRTLLVGADSNGKCLVGKKFAGTDDKTYQAASTQPFDYKAFMGATVAAPAGAGPGTH